MEPRRELAPPPKVPSSSPCAHISRCRCCVMMHLMLYADSYRPSSAADINRPCAVLRKAIGSAEKMSYGAKYALAFLCTPAAPSDRSRSLLSFHTRLLLSVSSFHPPPPHFLKFLCFMLS
jgi:hypothetical protein